MFELFLVTLGLGLLFGLVFICVTGYFLWKNPFCCALCKANKIMIELYARARWVNLILNKHIIHFEKLNNHG